MIAFFDCFSGVSGDMLLGALLDAGWPEKEFFSLPGLLGLDDVRLGCNRVSRNGISGIHVTVESGQPGEPRTLAVIERLLQAASLPARVRKEAVTVFRLLAEAEARVHDCGVEEVHFHEIGAVDTIIDVTGVLLALYQMNISECLSSPLPVSRGSVKCAHGEIPVPAPAVGALMQGVTVNGAAVEGELVTPTGLAVLKVKCSGFGVMPSMEVRKTGMGAGSREHAVLPNLLRVWIGRREAEFESVCVLTACMDDMNPEVYPYVMERLLEAGALDVYVRQLVMKKGRPGCELVVLGPAGREHGLCSMMLAETSTAGVRIRREARMVVPREAVTVTTPYGEVVAKLLERPDGRRELVPEYEECRRIARLEGVPLAAVYHAVRQGWKGRECS